MYFLGHFLRTPEEGKSAHCNKLCQMKFKTLQQNRRKQRHPNAGDEARLYHVVPVLVHGQLHEIGHDALPDAFLELIVAASLEDGPQE